MINNKNKSKLIFKGKRILRNNLNNKTNYENNNSSDLSDIFSSPVKTNQESSYQGVSQMNQMNQMSQMQMPQMNQLNMLQNLAQLSNIPNFQNIDPLMINVGGPMIPQSNLPGMDSNYFQQQMNGFQGMTNVPALEKNYSGSVNTQLSEQSGQFQQVVKPSTIGTSMLQNLSQLNNQIPQFN